MLTGEWQAAIMDLKVRVGRLRELATGDYPEGS
jgi:hypothetical protein